MNTETRLSATALRQGGARAQELDILATWASWYEDAIAAFTDVEVGGASTQTVRAIATARATVRDAHRLAVANLP